MTRTMMQKGLIQQNLKLSFLEKELPSIEKGTIYNIVTQKIINPYGFILVACKHAPINHFYIATYSINLKAMEIITNLMDAGLIKKWTLVLNCNMKFKMKGKDVVLLEEEKKRDNFRIIKKYSHAKVTLIEQPNIRLVIQGSGNYSENPKIEQYTICDDQNLFDFHRGWMEDTTL
jgi:hypothetical protein